VLLALLLIPLSASAQRRSRNRPSDEELDPVCRRAESWCWKLRLGVVGGGVLTTQRAGPGFGVKGGVTLLLLPKLELGAQFVGMMDVLGENRPFIGSGEGLLRVVLRSAKDQRLFLDLSGGVAMLDSPEFQNRVLPAASLGTSYEVATGYTSGLFVTGGLTVLRAERWTALPHLGVGFFL
jgi:hypothetical protein